MWTAVLVVCVGIAGLLGLQQVFRLDTDEAENAGILSQSQGPAPTGSAENTGEVKDTSIAALKTEQLELGQRLMREFPRSEVPVVLMGHIHEGHGQNDKAIELWHRALVMNPGRADVCNSIATIEMGRGRYDEAIRFWKKALEIAPQTPKLRSDVALALMVMGRQEEAITELEQELAVNPQSGLAHFLLGKAHLQQKAFNKAKSHFASAVKLQPRDAGAYYGLVTACRRLGLQTEATAYAQTFQELKAEEREAEKTQDKVYNDALMTRQRLAEIFVRAGEIYGAAGKIEKAEALLNRALTCSPKNAAYMLKLASLYKTTDRLSEALALYKDLAVIDPAHPECKANISVLTAKVKQISQAEAVFSETLSRAPLSSSAHRTLARFYLEKQMNLPRARALAEKAVSLEPIAANYIILGWACDSQGDRQNARAATKRAVELEPHNQQYQRAYEHFKQKK